MAVVMAEAFHPSIYIKEELEAREWSIADLAKLMPGDYGINFVALEFYLDIGPETPGLKMGPQAIDISRAFGVNDDIFPNLERAWLEHPTTKAALLKELH
jgi:hypothetical protein